MQNVSWLMDPYNMIKALVTSVFQKILIDKISFIGPIPKHKYQNVYLPHVFYSGSIPSKILRAV